MSDHDDLADENAALRADNARLRRLLDEAGLHDGLRHALRDTLALLRAIVRRTAESAEDVEDYAAHLDGRLDAIAQVRATLDMFGEADLHTLVSDTLMAHVVREGERATLDGPSVRLRPKAAQVMALALHELASNGIEHGPLCGADGRVDVSWHREASDAGPGLALTWKESGGAGVTVPDRRGFGTTVLEEMLTYDLGGRASLSYAPDGLRCTIRLPLTARVGRVVEAAAAAF